jgi:D-alanyl-D-alanine carboxypeptidase
MRFFMMIWLIVLLGVSSITAALAQEKPQGRYASIIVDAQSLDIIHARQIDEIRYPASLTKVMTLYLTFDAIANGQLNLNDRLTVSATAAATAPTKLGLRKGQTISVDTLIRAVAVRSANDAAVVLAEHLSGTEHDFAVLMTAKARQLGMQKTTFKTANGLPHPEQLTTARDMAKLANAVLSNHGRFYHYFGLMSFEYRGRTYENTNKLLRQRNDVDGFKTGYTRDSGYNLIVSAERNGRRLIAIVLGGASGASRNSHMSDLVDRGFDVIKVSDPILTVANRSAASPKRSVRRVVTDPDIQSQLRTIPVNTQTRP